MFSFVLVLYASWQCAEIFVFYVTAVILWIPRLSGQTEMLTWSDFMYIMDKRTLFGNLLVGPTLTGPTAWVLEGIYVICLSMGTSETLLENWVAIFFC